MKKIIKIHRKYLITGLIAVVVVLYFVFGRGENGRGEYVVGNANLTQSVVLSGKVTTSDKADLGFAASGRVSQIFIKNNQKVNKGAVLTQLEIGDLLADLKIKQANLRQENTEIESAYRTLLTEDLELVPSSDSYDVEPPIVSGIYDGPEGQYKIRIKKKDTTLTDFTLSTFNLEKTEKVIEKERPTPLGTKGLYISFPNADIYLYQDTIWYLDIPNKSSFSYLSNLNAYNEAKNDQDLATRADSVAQAEIQKIQAEIRKNTIYAPFNGVVTNIEKEVGENADIGERVISILGEEKLEVVLQVSELDVSKLVPDSSVQISIDAIPSENFYGILKTVNSRETEIDGVPVYEAFIELASNGRIKTGMSASGIVILASKENVLAIPLYLVKKVGDKNFVKVILEDGSIKEQEVTLGLVGTDSMIEVISGLNLGDKIFSDDGKE